MTATISHEQEGGLIRATFEGDFDIYSVTEMKDQLVDLLMQADHLKLNLSAVNTLDTSGLQVLVLLKKESAALGKHVQYEEHSQAVIEVFDLMNMTSFFGDPVVLTS